MNAKISVFVICVEAIIDLLSHNLHDCTFKNPLKFSCIDLIITNRPKSFQSFVTVEIGLSFLHKMTLTVMKVFYKKQKTNIATYRNYKHFSNEAFMFKIVLFK